ncbi:MAG: gamma-glutamylcyclotransferase [Cyanobacteriota bacterium]|jgi:gamma-glutamylcyclotransferase (GGCT)/AIG2-like uncharacterized protein YtfP
MTHCRVFVYGTLKPGESNYGAYCEGKVLVEEKAYCWGRLYGLNLGYPGLTQGTERVWGYLLTFRDPRSLEDLDVLEDYQPGRAPSENEYQRRLTPIYGPNHQPLGVAWVYIMTPATIQLHQGRHLPAGEWSGFPNPGHR